MIRNIKMMLHDPKAEPKQHGNWIDVKFSGLEKAFKGLPHMDGDVLKYSAGDVFRVSLGFSAELEPGYEANLLPRSSTRKNYGVLLTNSMGVIDSEYNGDDDVWRAEFIAIEDGQMTVGDRILQFTVKKSPEVKIEFVESLGNENRGGYGSTGK